MKPHPVAVKTPPKQKALTRYWLEYYLCDSTNLCTLCGNTGVIDTTLTAISPAGIRAGRQNWCICPNGQGMRKSGMNLKKNQ